MPAATRVGRKECLQEPWLAATQRESPGGGAGGGPRGFGQTITDKALTLFRLMPINSTGTLPRCGAVAGILSFYDNFSTGLDVFAKYDDRTEAFGRFCIHAALNGSGRIWIFTDDCEPRQRLPPRRGRHRPEILSGGG